MHISTPKKESVMAESVREIRGKISDTYTQRDTHAGSEMRL